MSAVLGPGDFPASDSEAEALTARVEKARDAIMGSPVLRAEAALQFIECSRPIVGRVAGGRYVQIDETPETLFDEWLTDHVARGVRK